MRLCKTEALLLIEYLFKPTHCVHCGNKDNLQHIGQKGNACTDKELFPSYDLWECDNCHGQWQNAVEITSSFAINLCKRNLCTLCEEYETE